LAPSRRSVLSRGEDVGVDEAIVGVSGREIVEGLPADMSCLLIESVMILY
jgi:hypothetical protein